MLILPSDLVPWIPRNRDVFDIMTLLLSEKTKVVKVFGMPGVGKSGVMKKVTLYLADRNLYPGGIIF